MRTEKDKAALVISVLEELGLSAADLAEVLNGASDEPTVREFLEKVISASTPGSCKTYGPYWRRLVSELGDRTIRSVRTSDVRALALEVQRAAVRRANSRDGRSAQEHFVGAARAFFRLAVEDGIIDSNPAAAVQKPRRQPSNRRGFTPNELVELHRVTISGGDDPLLDSLLFRFHLETGARRGGALQLRRRDVDTERQVVRLREKNDTVRWQPVSRTLIEALLAHMNDRGVTKPDELVFRRRGRGAEVAHPPMSRKRYNTLAARWQRELDWCAELNVSIHWFRHHATSSIERIGGYAVARAFAGHSSSDETTTTYIKAHTFEVARAVAIYTGESHPLADVQAG